MTIETTTELAEKLYKRHRDEERYYGGPINPLLKDSADELCRLYNAYKEVTEAWLRSERRISTLLAEKQQLEARLDRLDIALRNICDVLDEVSDIAMELKDYDEEKPN